MSYTPIDWFNLLVSCVCFAEGCAMVVLCECFFQDGVVWDRVDHRCLQSKHAPWVVTMFGLCLLSWFCGQGAAGAPQFPCEPCKKGMTQHKSHHDLRPAYNRDFRETMHKHTRVMVVEVSASLEIFQRSRTHDVKSVNLLHDCFGSKSQTSGSRKRPQAHHLHIPWRPLKKGPKILNLKATRKHARSLLTTPRDADNNIRMKSADQTLKETRLLRSVVKLCVWFLPWKLVGHLKEL